MAVRLAVYVVAIASLAAAPASQPTATAPARRAVGQVMGTTIYAEDLGITEPVAPGIQFDATHEQLWGQMETVSRAFGGPIIERFKAATDVKATDVERAAFGRFMHASQRKQLAETERQVADIEKQLAGPGLTPDGRQKLEQELARRTRDLDYYRKSVKDGPEHWAHGADFMIEPWKFQRNLHRRYGGRIIFQQFGPEALDGMRRLFEDAEKAGDLRIDDPGARHLFYYYYNMKHTPIDDATVLENPWFLRDPTTQPAE